LGAERTMIRSDVRPAAKRSTGTLFSIIHPGADGNKMAGMVLFATTKPACFTLAKQAGMF